MYSKPLRGKGRFHHEISASERREVAVSGGGSGLRSGWQGPHTGTGAAPPTGYGSGGAGGSGFISGLALGGSFIDGTTSPSLIIEPAHGVMDQEPLFKARLIRHRQCRALALMTGRSVPSNAAGRTGAAV